MKTLIPADAVASRLCIPPKNPAGAALRRSRFCVSLPCEAGTLLYHTLTGELRLLSAGESLEQHRDALARACFLVPADWDEVRFARQLRKVLAATMRSKGKTAFVVLPTTACNARCHYCFERGVKPVTMTIETARAVAAYMERHCAGKPISLHWFGGEPLYNKPAIDAIAAELNARGVRFSSRMTSNGFYLDPETSIRAKRDWHLEQVQITLDGTETVYNRVKRYRDEEANPYQRVMRNIAGALDAGIGVIVRLNMDKANADDLFRLADELRDRFEGRAGLSVVVVLLREVAGKIRCFDSEEEAIARRIELTEKVARYGFGYPTGELSGKLIVNKCNADNDAAEVILPDGGIARCEHVNCAGTVGSIFDEKRDEAEIQSWKETAHFPECEECALLPRCGVLKRCEWVKNGCPQNTRDAGMRMLNAQILEAYRKICRTGSEKTNETER